MKTMTRLSGILIVIMFCNSCGSGYTSNKVDEAIGVFPSFHRIDISEPDRFLNDLMLSPFWKVEKQRDGSFIAKARSIGQAWPSEGNDLFLFEFMTAQHRSLPKNYRIHNKYLRGRDRFSSFMITVSFQKPDLKSITLGTSEQKATIPIYESYDNKIGSNSFSDLAIKLSSQHEIYVTLHEQGKDPNRIATFKKVLPVLQQLAGLASIAQTYRVEERYTAFFRMFFTLPLKDQKIERFPGTQDRDTFYGYFRSKPSTRYTGLNIKISHPVYCPDEGTRKYSRLQKAEYSGKPYLNNDILFFLIEDNAVYLSSEYDQRFGTFTGKESFEGDLEVLNDREAVLLKTTGQFKGWQR